MILFHLVTTNTLFFVHLKVSPFPQNITQKELLFSCKHEDNKARYKEGLLEPEDG